MPTLNWSHTSNLVSTTPGGQDPARIEADQGSTDLRIIITEGPAGSATQKLLPVGVAVGIAIRDPANLKLGYLGGPTILTRGSSAATGYIGTTDTYSPLARALMHSDDDDSEPEAISYPAQAVLYYLPLGGGRAIVSKPFSWTIFPAYYRPLTPPANIIQVWPAPEQLIAAISQAAAGIQSGGDANLNSLGVGSLSFGALSVVFDSTILGVSQDSSEDPSEQPWSLMVLDGESHAGFLNVPPGKLPRRKPDGTGWDAITPNNGDGSGLTNLDASQLTGTIALARLPAAVAGALHYKGTWNAATNSPALASGAGETGGYYVVSVSGTTGLDGVGVWTAGDHVVFDGTRWDKLDGAANPVSSVAGRQGAITLSTADVADAVATGSSPSFGVVTATNFVGSGAGLTNVAPFHPVTPGAITGTTTTPASGCSILSQFISDNSGQIKIQTSAAFQVGDVLLTVNLATAVPGPGLTSTQYLPHALVVQGADNTAVGGMFIQTRSVHTFGAKIVGNALTIYAGPSYATSTAPGNISLSAIASGENIVINYATFVN